MCRNATIKILKGDLEGVRRGLLKLMSLFTSLIDRRGTNDSKILNKYTKLYEKKKIDK